MSDFPLLNGWLDQRMEAVRRGWGRGEGPGYVNLACSVKCGRYFMGRRVSVGVEGRRRCHDERIFSRGTCGSSGEDGLKTPAPEEILLVAL